MEATGCVTHSERRFAVLPSPPAAVIRKSCDAAEVASRTHAPHSLELLRSDLCREARDNGNHLPWATRFRLEGACFKFAIVLADTSLRMHREPNVGTVRVPWRERAEEVAAISHAFIELLVRCSHPRQAYGMIDVQVPTCIIVDEGRECKKCMNPFLKQVAAPNPGDRRSRCQLYP